jgi:hypothetical protein
VSLRPRLANGTRIDGPKPRPVRPMQVVACTLLRTMAYLAAQHDRRTVKTNTQRGSAVDGDLLRTIDAQAATLARLLARKQQAAYESRDISARDAATCI